MVLDALIDGLENAKLCGYEERCLSHLSNCIFQISIRNYDCVNICIQKVVMKTLSDVYKVCFYGKDIFETVKLSTNCQVELLFEFLTYFCIIYIFVFFFLFKFYFSILFQIIYFNLNVVEMLYFILTVFVNRQYLFLFFDLIIFFLFKKFIYM